MFENLLTGTGEETFYEEIANAYVREKLLPNVFKEHKSYLKDGASGT